MGTRAVALALALASAAAPVAAQQGLAFTVAMGGTGMSGEWADVFKGGVDADLNITYLLPSGVRFGAGVYLISYDLEPPLQDETVSNVELHLIGGYVLGRGRLRPYGQVRLAYVRLRPEGHTFGSDTTGTGENAGPRREGTGGTLVVGTEFAMTRHVALDANVWTGAYTTAELDLAPIGGGVVSKGRSYGARLGITWYAKP